MQNTCRNCGKPIDFAVCCKAKNIAGVDRLSEAFDEESKLKGLTVQISAVESDTAHAWLMTATVGRRRVTFKSDTGAQADLLPRCLCAKLGRATNIPPSKMLLTGYKGNVTENLGTAS